MKLGMLKPFHHVQRSRVFTSKLHSIEEGIFVSKIDMKHQFLAGLNSASSYVTRSYAQVVSQGVKKNAVDNKKVYWKMGVENKKKKFPNMAIQAGAHKVTMCNTSGHIKTTLSIRGSEVHTKHLTNKYQKRCLTNVSVHHAGDPPVLTENRFDSLTVEPSLEDNCQMVNTASVVTQTQKGDKHEGSNLLLDTSLQGNCHIVASGLVNTHIPSIAENTGLNPLRNDASFYKNCPDTGSGPVVTQIPKERYVGSNSAHNNARVTGTQCTVTAGHKDTVLEKAKEQIGTAFGCLPLSTI